VFAGSGKTIYHNRHYFRPWWAVADDLTLSRIDKPFKVKAGNEISKLTALIAPDRSRQKTSDLSLTVLNGSRDSVGLIADGHLAAANFEPRPRTLEFTVARTSKAEMPIFVGETEIGSREVRYRLALQSQEATLRGSARKISTDGTLNISTTETGRVLIRNSGRKQAEVVDVTSGEKVRIRIGETLEI
jgi:hypothetical protein